MNRNYKTLLIILAVVAAGAAAFLLLDFRLLRSQTNTEHTSSSIAFNNPDGEAQIPANQSLDIYILGNDPISRRLGSALVLALADNPYAANVQVYSGEPAEASDSVLVIEPIDSRWLWTPVYGSADLEIQYYYASDGKVHWIGQEVMQSEPGEFTKRIIGTLSESDRSLGLLSLPGYARFLAENIARDISNLLQSTLRG